MFEPMPFEREKHVYRCDEFSELLKDAVRFFHGTPVCKFPPDEKFAGAGVYALYYIGKTGIYAKFGQEINREEYKLPIYVGKAEPTRGCDSDRDLDGQFRILRTEIIKKSGLRLKDFRVRCLERRNCSICREVGAFMRRRYRPIWNRLMPRGLNGDAVRGISAQVLVQRYLESV